MNDVAASAADVLRHEVEAARALLANYQDILGDDAELSADTIEGETNLHEAMRFAVRRIAEIDAMCIGLKAMAEKMRDRADRFAKQRETLRTALLSAMDVAGIRKLETDIATLARRKAPVSVIVTSEADIPSRFWLSSDPRLDRKSLLDVLKTGETVPGAELSNGGETLHIHWG